MRELHAASAWIGKARSTRASSSLTTACWTGSTLTSTQTETPLSSTDGWSFPAILRRADRLNGRSCITSRMSRCTNSFRPPFVTYRAAMRSCGSFEEYVIGADGFHGVSRKSMPKEVLREYERVYPFGWLGVLSRTKPVSPELIYSAHQRGFALCGCGPGPEPLLHPGFGSRNGQNWSDAAFWMNSGGGFPKSRLGHDHGPSIEKSIAPLRIFVAVTMRFGRLFQAEDAAHIVPPTGARGLNSALSDIYYLYHAIIDHYQKGNDQGLDGYSDRALARVGRRSAFLVDDANVHSSRTTALRGRLQKTELAYLLSSERRLARSPRLRRPAFLRVEGTLMANATIAAAQSLSSASRRPRAFLDGWRTLPGFRARVSAYDTRPTRPTRRCGRRAPTMPRPRCSANTSRDRGCRGRRSDSLGRDRHQAHEAAVAALPGVEQGAFFFDCDSSRAATGKNRRRGRRRTRSLRRRRRRWRRSIRVCTALHYSSAAPTRRPPRRFLLHRHGGRDPRRAVRFVVGGQDDPLDHDEGARGVVCECVLAGRKAGSSRRSLICRDTYPGFDWRGAWPTCSRG